MKAAARSCTVERDVNIRSPPIIQPIDRAVKTDELFWRANLPSRNAQYLSKTLSAN